MKPVVIAYFATLVCMAAIDFVWLSVMADWLYRPVMGDMLLSDFRLAPAVLFYLLYAAGVAFLAVRPALNTVSPGTAMVNGAVVGFTAYATYDLTNQATLRNWSSALTIADIVWGTLLTAVAAGVGYMIASREGRPPAPEGSRQ